LSRIDCPGSRCGQSIAIYAVATTGEYVDQAAGITMTGSGTPGSTTGAQRVFLFTTGLLPLIRETAAEEQAHVKLIRSALTAAGATPIAKPAINLGALGFGFVYQTTFYSWRASLRTSELLRMQGQQV
jgi:hypothetical protein